MESAKVQIQLPDLAKQALFADQLYVPDEYTRAKNTNYKGSIFPINDQQFKYGTAGFRANDNVMPFIAYRTGVFAGFRARQLGKTIGLMITASHNPYQDNGIKLIDPMGEMLDVTLEDRLTQLINMSDEEYIQAIKTFERESPKPNLNAYVHIGYDTRPSSSQLSLAAANAIEQTGVQFVPNGEVTTPQLHYRVRATNDPSYGPIDSLTQRFTSAVDLFYENTDNRDNLNYTPTLHVDCANGVGSNWVRIYSSQLSHPIIKAEVINFNVICHEDLNRSCGADFVKIENRMPVGMEKVPAGSRCCSLDGDADRLVYYYQRKVDHEFRLLDGDHISALFTHFLLDHLRQLKLTDMFTFGVIQTAYANGNSTRYFKDKMKCTVKCVKTGTKYLQLASREFDTAVHFEANGHGTVALSDKFRSFIEQTFQSNKNDKLVGRLYAFCRIINECVGDGIADMLAVEQVLRHYDWSIEMWEQETYTNAHCVQLKIPVEDRDLYETAADSETTLVKPEGMQENVDTLIAKYKNSRAFVRPSGTENILRVYAEAQSLSEATALADNIRDLLNNSMTANSTIQ